MGKTTKPKKRTPNYPKGTWREKLARIIFGTETVAGKTFDVALLVAILLSVAAIMLESVKEIRENHGALLFGLEWFFTILFSFEYIARMISVSRPKKYALSFFGIIDLISILPTYVSLFTVGAQGLMVIRIFRLLRVFRIFKLVRFMGEARALGNALKASRPKITVFLVAVLTVVVIIGTIMFMIEGPEHGFTSIPKGIYWAIVTVTTVGYGDLVPLTPIGQTLASALMIMGYGIIAVPTGIFSAEIVKADKTSKDQVNNEACSSCGNDGHDFGAHYCKFCGAKL